MAKRKRMSYSPEHPFPSPVRPNHERVYSEGMVKENGMEFCSAPSEEYLSQFPHHTYGVAGLGAELNDGDSGMDRHVDYIVPTGTNNKFEAGGQ